MYDVGCERALPYEVYMHMYMHMCGPHRTKLIALRGHGARGARGAALHRGAALSSGDCELAPADLPSGDWGGAISASLLS